MSNFAAAKNLTHHVNRDRALKISALIQCWRFDVRVPRSDLRAPATLAQEPVDRLGERPAPVAPACGSVRGGGIPVSAAAPPTLQIYRCSTEALEAASALPQFDLRPLCFPIHEPSCFTDKLVRKPQAVNRRSAQMTVPLFTTAFLGTMIIPSRM